MSDVLQPIRRPLPSDSRHDVGSKSLYQSPGMAEAETQRVERARKRESRLQIIRSIKARKG